MRLRGISFVITLLASASSASPPAADRPSAVGQARMAQFLGVWNFRAHGEDTPFQRAGDWYGTLDGEWYPGRYAVVRNNVMTGSDGRPTRIHQMLAFDRTRGRYHLFEVTEDGFVGDEEVEISDDVITARHDQIIGGRPWHMRWTLRTLDPAHRRYVREYSADGVEWHVCWTSEETRG